MSRRFSAKRHYVYAGLRHFANLAGLVAVGAVVGARFDDQIRRISRSHAVKP